MKLHPYLFFIQALLVINFTWAQKNIPSFILKDSLQSNFSINDIHDFDVLEKKLNNEGYYFFNITPIKKDSTETYLIDLGKKTSIIGIQQIPENIQQIFKSKKETIYISPIDTQKWIRKINSDFDQKGKNFTEIKLINHTLRNDTLFCDLFINQSNKRFIDKTVIKGYERFPKKFLKHYIATKRPFSKELLNITEKKINQLTFVKNIKKPAVLFTKDSTHLYLYLDRVKANKLDALLGFSNKARENKIRFNGYVDISLTNTLHKGETFAFKWNNTGNDQQEIDLNIDNPYIFNSPINAAYHLNIFRRDSTFVNTQHEFSLGYRPHYKHLINTYYHTESSSALNTSNANIIEYTKNIFGIQYTYNELNRFGIPKNRVKFDIGLGTKKNPTANTQQQTFKSDIIYTIEINPINHVFIENRNAYLRSPNKNINELYRTGGATTMRGFLEQNIVAHLYNYANIEYRYFTNLASYIYGFSDVGYFKNITQENNLLSFGLGYTMGIPSGLLKISYAVGKNQDTSFNLNSGLFHINFVTIF
ncbi:BamA/TamA family outer membrane protein [Wenyingzhuangia marina]|uniref:Surface antigen n=1 Tax=Wenyingzhuangia marina TaxID=1195760 RepID=A0A1M5WIT9_9FLAO|nr:BamA/TamA family outer membrane protein [Wenyingzhuangia marina]GGF80774.1 membrane protein [Wenyingzhuangia marina]SHH87113.1 Surface antigen [Wenyingzhuangia marina]